jgi:hypothetical protein
LVRHELDGRGLPRLDGPGVHTEPADGKSVDHVLRLDAEANPLASVHHDAVE